MLSLELLAAAALWFGSGMTCVSILYRRGHDGWHWFAVGAVAGPLTALFVADQARFVEPVTPPTELRPPWPGTGGVVVIAPARLADLDAVAAAVSRLAPAGPVTIVTAVRYETSAAGADDRRFDAVANLERAAARLADHNPGIVLLHGPLPDAVVAHVAEHDAAAVVAARSAHSARCLGRLARLAARRPGLSLVLADPALAPAPAPAT